MFHLEPRKGRLLYSRGNCPDRADTRGAKRRLMATFCSRVNVGTVAAAPRRSRLLQQLPNGLRPIVAAPLLLLISAPITMPLGPSKLDESASLLLQRVKTKTISTTDSVVCFMKSRRPTFQLGNEKKRCLSGIFIQEKHRNLL